MNFCKSLINALLSIMFLVAAPTITIMCNSQETEAAKRPHVQQDNCDCKNEIDIRKLCAHILLADCVDSERISARDLCADEIKSPYICADRLNLNSTLCVDQIDTNHANIVTLNTNDICVAGTLSANDTNLCNKVRATMVFSANTVYDLKSNIDWDVILDDPNGNASDVPPSHYIAPKGGYYLLTLQVDAIEIVAQNGLPILGSPIANPKIWVNGVVHRESFSPFLAFLDSQHTTLTTVIKLNAGDVVTTSYEILILDSTVGVVSLEGTATLLGNGTDANQAIFKIVLVAPDCDTTPCVPVEPCQPHPCDASCTPCCECTCS